MYVHMHNFIFKTQKYTKVWKFTEKMQSYLKISFKSTTAFFMMQPNFYILNWKDLQIIPACYQEEKNQLPGTGL